MPADLTEIRALLASLRGFTPGPWEWVDAVDGIDSAIALIAAAPTLHAHLTDLVGEVERLRRIVDRAQDAVYAAAVAPLEEMEHNQQRVGNGHRVAQEIAADFGKWLIGGVHPLPSEVSNAR